MKIVAADLVARWMSVQKNDDSRELFFEKQGFKKFQATIDAYIADAELAQREIDDHEDRIEQGPGSAPRVGGRMRRKEVS